MAEATYAVVDKKKKRNRSNRCLPDAEVSESVYPMYDALQRNMGPKPVPKRNAEIEGPEEEYSMITQVTSKPVPAKNEEILDSK